MDSKTNRDISYGEAYDSLDFTREDDSTEKTGNDEKRKNKKSTVR